MPERKNGGTVRIGALLRLLGEGAVCKRPIPAAGANPKSYPRYAEISCGSADYRVTSRTLETAEDAGYVKSFDSGNWTCWVLTAKGSSWIGRAAGGET